MERDEPSKRILMMADANFLAHTSRLLEIARCLRDDHGHRIHFAGDGRFMRLPREDGFPTDWTYTVPGETTLRLAKKAGLVDYTWWSETVWKSIMCDCASIERVRPDVVVGDMHWSLKAAASLLGVPYVSVTNACWTRYYSVELKAFDDHFTTRIMGRRLAARALPALKNYAAIYWALPYQKFAKKHGLDPSGTDSLWSLLEGDLTLLADIEEYGPTEDRPDSVRYVGPILWEPRLPMPDWFGALDPERPTLYFTMGSSGEPEFFRMAIELFGGTQFQVMITTGGMTAQLGSLPDNVFVEDFAPGLALMKRADVVVNHGGNGTLYQAMQAGVPVVGIPTHVDQQLNLQRAESLGIAIKLRERTLSRDELSAAVTQILENPSYRAASQKYKRSLERYDGPRQAAGEIHEFMKSRTSAFSESRPGARQGSRSE